MLRSLFFVLLVYLIRTEVSGECGPYWTPIGLDYCYREGDTALTWWQANRECNNLDAVLVRLIDPKTVSDLRILLRTSNDTRWWTGLNDVISARDWVFDIGPNSVYPDDPTVFDWIREPDDKRHLQNCVALNIQGSVSDERCSDYHRYICEYTNTKGTCLEGWMSYSTSCYLFPVGRADNWGMMTWTDADAKCRSILAGTAADGVNSHLLFLETKDEQNYIRQQLPAVSLTSEIWWVGLTDSETEGQFKWTDGSPVGDFVFWAEEANNLGAQERCVYMNRNISLADYNCNNTANYVCMKEDDRAEVVPGMGCPYRYYRAGHQCYLLETNTKKTWTDGQTACVNDGGNLMKIDTVDKVMWLQFQSAAFESGLWFWTGLNTKSTSNNKQALPWQWADGTSANMSLIRWVSEPNNYKGDENCATIMNTGYFNDVSCNSLLGYICEMNVEDSGCPNNWFSYDAGDFLNCYYVSDDEVTFEEAHAACLAASFPADSFLVAVNDKNELDLIQKKLAARNSAVTEYYTGLTDQGNEGIWTYDTDWNHPPDAGLIPWVKMPMFPDGDENCVAILFGGQYINRKCSETHAYICERPAINVNFNPSSNTPAAVSASNAGCRIFSKKFSVSSVFVVMTYFLVYGLCLHYVLHLTYVLFPAYA